jgi:hypothetical protein
MLISIALLLDSNIRNSVCTPAKLPCRRVEVGYEKTEMGVSDEAKNVIPLKFLHKIKNQKNFSLVNSIRGHTVYY